MNILIVEDEPIYVMGLCVLLRQSLEVTVVGHVPSAREAFVMVERHEPDIVLLDIGLPGMDGFAAAREIRRRVTRSRIVMLTGRRSATDVAEAVKAGAAAFVTKSDAPDQIVEALRKVAAGERFFASTLSKPAADVSQMAAPRDALARLTEREREVFALLVSGLPNNGVARELCISRKTLDTHRHRIYEKLGCHSLAELIRFAAHNALLAEQHRGWSIPRPADA